MLTAILFVLTALMPFPVEEVLQPPIDVPHKTASLPCYQTLPAAEERTDIFWTRYLNETLQSCFAEFDGGVRQTTVYVREDLPFGIAFSGVGPWPLWEMERRWEIFVQPSFLSGVRSSEEAVFIIGHEVAHILMHGDMQRGLANEEELIADLFAAHRIEHGSCVGARVAQLLLERQGEHADARTDRIQTLTQQRRSALLAHCALPVLTAKKKTPNG